MCVYRDGERGKPTSWVGHLLHRHREIIFSFPEAMARCDAVPKRENRRGLQNAAQPRTFGIVFGLAEYHLGVVNGKQKDGRLVLIENGLF